MATKNIFSCEFFRFFFHLFFGGRNEDDKLKYPILFVFRWIVARFFFGFPGRLWKEVARKGVNTTPKAHTRTAAAYWKSTVGNFDSRLLKLSMMFGVCVCVFV